MSRATTDTVPELAVEVLDTAEFLARTGHPVRSDGVDLPGSTGEAGTTRPDPGAFSGEAPGPEDETPAPASSPDAKPFAAPEVAVLTLASADRATRARRQHSALLRALPGEFDSGAFVHVVGVMEGVPRLAEARNAAAREAAARGAGVLVFLDADCLPDPALIPRYREAAERHPQALLAGPVTYLTAEETGEDLDAMLACRHPHPGRPDPATGTERVVGPTGPEAAEYDLFWSLSFAVTPAVFERIGGFHEGYLGYGGEDTDFARSARAAGVGLVWVGGADAVHQHHPVSSPPVEHLHDILANARRFRDRWGEWPMLGWLRAFRDMGLVREDPHKGWVAVEGTESSGPR